MTPNKYNDLNELLAEFSELCTTLATIEAEVNLSQITAARPLLPDHANTTARIGEIEDRLRKIAQDNPELFPEPKRTHQTPFGSIAFRKSKRLEIRDKDEEKAILKVKVACSKELKRAELKNEPPRFTEETLLRKREELNLEALETFEDAELPQFGVDRVEEEKFSAKPLQVKADKLAKKTEKPENN